MHLGNILELERRRASGELADILSCMHATDARLEDLQVLELVQHGARKAYVCCAKCARDAMARLPTVEL